MPNHHHTRKIFTPAEHAGLPPVAASPQRPFIAEESVRKSHQAPAGWAAELARANVQLTQEIDERRRAEGSLQGAYAEVKRCKDRLEAENIYLQQELAQEYNFGQIVGQSPAMLQVVRRVEQLAALNAAVLLRGEAGTGKGVVARALHNLSTRRDRPMITVNLSALPNYLVESELFGWERGECTGADARQIGRFELADAGTVLLEEIGELPLKVQDRLLRLIRDGELERLGSPCTIKVNARVIAATSRDLEEEVRAGRFREDLYRTLKVFAVDIPPLRQRKEDIPLLVEHFIAKYHAKIGTRLSQVPSQSLSALQAYDWPGNVRELESVIEREVITQGSELGGAERPDRLTTDEVQARGGEIKALAELEQDYILLVLQKTGWRIEGAQGTAALLGLNPSTLRARMRKYGILRNYSQSL